MNNDNNDFRKMKEGLANKKNIIFHHMKINMLVLSKMSKKTKHCNIMHGRRCNKPE